MSAGRDLPGRVRRALRRFAELHDEFFVSKWRSGLQREARRQQDLLLTLVFLESLGVENPATYYTLELYPELVAGFHDWHRRQGMEHAPEPGFCC
jgi:hypothetical protein